MKTAVRFAFALMLVATMMLYKPVKASAAAGGCTAAQAQIAVKTCSSEGYGSCGASANGCDATCTSDYGTDPNGSLGGVLADCEEACAGNYQTCLQNFIGPCISEACGGNP